MKILAIDTSCDETSAAITDNEVILANVISSQVQLHKKWGGVVPAIAQRAHKERIVPTIKEALQQAGFKLEDIELIAVTYGPGLAIALEVGVAKAKELANQYKKPLVAVNHMAGHIYANLAKNLAGKAPVEKIEYPSLALLVSGGHTELVLIKAGGQLEIIGQTLDDAMGEAYDKVAKILGLGYPGGPTIARLAKQGDSRAYSLPIAMKNSQDLNLSFSGLKTAVLYLVKQLIDSSNDRKLSKQQIIDIAASFQRVAFESVILKLERAVKKYHVKQVLLGGGVIANTDFRRAIRAALKPFNISVAYPNLIKLCTDNAAMIAVAGYYQFQRGEIVNNIDRLDRDPIASL